MIIEVHAMTMDILLFDNIKLNKCCAYTVILFVSAKVNKNARTCIQVQYKNNKP